MRLLVSLPITASLYAQAGFFPLADVRPGMRGMSGSPVHIGVRLLGAVAMTFACSKEPIAAIRPIEDLISPCETTPQQRPRPRSQEEGTGVYRQLDAEQPNLQMATEASTEPFARL
jgi:hypothetical protein